MNPCNTLPVFVVVLNIVSECVIEFWDKAGGENYKGLYGTFIIYIGGFLNLLMF